MKNKCWIITSDIHIYDYKQYNNDGYNRLDKFVDLAHRLVEMGVENDADTLVLAGDILHKAVSTPRVLNTVDMFMKIVGEGFNEVLFIFGNHDVFSKSSTPDILDCAIPILAHGAQYMDGKERVINGNKIQFLNWAPDIKWDTFEHKADLLISHVCISELFGQYIDESKFKTMLAGDVHDCSNINNAHTINVPIPHYISDEQEGSVIILNPNTLKWKREITESEKFKYARMYYTDAVPARHKNDPLVQRVERAGAKVQMDAIASSIDVEASIKQAVETNSLQEIHTELAPHVNRDIETVSFQFQLIDIEITNFRSIDYLKHEFVPGLTLLSGVNGSGKSSILRAIDFALAGNGNPRVSLRKEQSPLIVKIRLSLAGRVHTITREWRKSGKLEYLIDDEEVNASSMAERNAIILENMPFLKYFNVLNRSQDCPRFLSQYGFTARIQMMQDLLGLNVIERYKTVANNQLVVRNNEIEEIESEINRLKSIIEDTDSDRFLTDIEDPERLNLVLKDLEDIKKEKTDDNRQFNERSELIVKHDQYEKESAGLDISANIHGLDIGRLKLDKKRIERQAATEEDHNKSVSLKLAELNSDKVRLTREIEELTNKTVQFTCPTCQQEISESIRDRLNHEVSTLLITKDNQFTSVVAKINEVPDEIPVATIKQSIVEYTKKIAEVEAAEKCLKRYAEVVEILKELRVEIGKFSSLLVDTPESYFDSLSVQIKDMVRTIAENDELIKAEIKFTADCEKMQTLSHSSDELRYELEAYQNYATLFYPNGVVVQSVFNEVSKMMSGDGLTVRTVKMLASGNPAIDFDVDFKVGELTLPYDELSGGQANLVDIVFIMKLFSIAGGAGMMILDETLRDLDEDALDIASKILLDAPINTILLSTHVSSYPWYAQKLNCELVDNVSHYHIEGK